MEVSLKELHRIREWTLGDLCVHSANFWARNPPREAPNRWTWRYRRVLPHSFQFNFILLFCKEIHLVQNTASLKPPALCLPSIQTGGRWRGTNEISLCLLSKSLDTPSVLHFHGYLHLYCRRSKLLACNVYTMTIIKLNLSHKQGQDSLRTELGGWSLINGALWDCHQSHVSCRWRKLSCSQLHCDERFFFLFFFFFNDHEWLPATQLKRGRIRCIDPDPVHLSELGHGAEAPGQFHMKLYNETINVHVTLYNRQRREKQVGHVPTDKRSTATLSTLKVIRARDATYECHVSCGNFQSV